MIRVFELKIRNIPDLGYVLYIVLSLLNTKAANAQFISEAYGIKMS
jgi:hypothetical protein